MNILDATSPAQIVARFLRAQDGLVTQASDLSLGSLAQMVDSRAIDTEPSYQRRHRWDAEKQSALIESFLLNIPVPPIYLSEDQVGRYSVVDGKQRLSAIADFMADRLKLKSLESMTEVEGKYFRELPEELRNALTIRPYLRVITILKQSSPLLKYEVFVRLNRGGESMEPQELRNVAFRGPLNDLIYRLGENVFLRRQLKIVDNRSSAYQLMADAEMVLRFLTLRDSWETFSGSLRTEMDNYMALHDDLPHADLDITSRTFERAIAICERLWGRHAFQRPTSSGWRDQFLNGVYDAQMLAADNLTDAESLSLEEKADAVLESTRQLFEDARFDRATREATNTPARIRFRVESVLSSLRALV